jgi:hypothetical protein
MLKKTQTHLFCFDDHRGFSEDVRKRFPDIKRYTVVSFQTQQEFLDHLEKVKENNFCRIAILGIHETKEQFEMIDKLTKEIKRIDPSAGLILLCPPHKMEEIKKIVKFNIEAYIPKNANTILRIHNAVKKLMSEYDIGIFRRRRNLSLYILLALLFLSMLLLLISYYNFPEYF